MSIKLIHEEIERFLSSTESEVLCIKGKWGVGKTYTWNQYLKKAISDKKVSLKRYAYLSLFGQKTLDDLRYSLFENTIEIEQINEGPSLESLKFNFKWFRKGVAILSKLPFFQSYIGNSERSLFFMVKNQIVCIDDFERASEDLDAMDILGLISLLKQQKKCKVVLLLNDEELSEENRKVFDKQLEKVADTVLKFELSPIEAADIVFQSPETSDDLLHNNCIILGITNIRVIKKIEIICKRLEEILSKTYPNVLKQALSSAILFGWIVNQPTEAPSIDFIKTYNHFHGLIKDDKKFTEEEKSWQMLLSGYEYTNTDEFDLVVLEGIQAGYFDADKLNKLASKLDVQIIKNNQDLSFKKAWDLYHNSFSINEKIVLDALYTSAMANVEVISPINLNGTVSFLKEFKRKKEALKLIEHYIEKRSDDKELYNIEHSAFSDQINDLDIVKAFAEKRKSFVDSRNPADVLENMILNHGWNPEDTDMLGNLSEDDFYKIFKENNGTRLHRIIRSALQFRSPEYTAVNKKTISENATKALQKIGSESRLNAKRVRMHGVSIKEKVKKIPK